MSGEADLAAIADEVRACTRCPLAAGRTMAVPGEGNPVTDVLLVGEGRVGVRTPPAGPSWVRPDQLLDELLDPLAGSAATCSSRTS